VCAQFIWLCWLEWRSHRHIRAAWSHQDARDGLSLHVPHLNAIDGLDAIALCYSLAQRRAASGLHGAYHRELPIHPLGVQQDANTDHLDARSVLVWQIVLCGRRKAPPIRQQPRHNAGRRLALQGVQIVQGVRGIPLVRVCPPHLPGLSEKGAQEPLPVLGASSVFPRVLTW
jgi:hypothetical protein